MDGNISCLVNEGIFSRLQAPKEGIGRRRTDPGDGQGDAILKEITNCLKTAQCTEFTAHKLKTEMSCICCIKTKSNTAAENQADLALQIDSPTKKCL